MKFPGKTILCAAALHLLASGAALSAEAGAVPDFMDICVNGPTASAERERMFRERAWRDATEAQRAIADIFIDQMRKTGFTGPLTVLGKHFPADETRRAEAYDAAVVLGAFLLLDREIYSCNLYATGADDGDGEVMTDRLGNPSTRVGSLAAQGVARSDWAQVADRPDVASVRAMQVLRDSAMGRMLGFGGYAYAVTRAAAPAD